MRCSKISSTENALAVTPAPVIKPGDAPLAVTGVLGVLATGLHGPRVVPHLTVDAAGIDRAAAAMRHFFNA